MMVMNVRIDNFFAFKNFHMNLSYPKKIVDSYIENEYLEGRPNFRYKKVNVIMGANATGKTDIGERDSYENCSKRLDHNMDSEEGTFTEDVEKAFLTVMIGCLKSKDQLFFTTHNTDILDLPLPKHAYTFLKKDCTDLEQPIKCISASQYLKRSTDSLRNAVDNDLFSAAPGVDLNIFCRWKIVSPPPLALYHLFCYNKTQLCKKF